MLVALTRERGRNDTLRSLIAGRAEVVEVPLTATDFRSLLDVEADIRATAKWGEFRSLVVTSTRCERYVAPAGAALAHDARVYSVGPATSDVLRRAGWAVTHESPDSALDLADVLAEGPVLILGAVEGREELWSVLRERGRDPYRIGCYRTRGVTLDPPDRATIGRADVVFIGAPSAWRIARDLVGARAWVVVPGATTRDAVAGDHPRVLVGWGADFEAAWRTLNGAA